MVLLKIVIPPKCFEGVKIDEKPETGLTDSFVKVQRANSLKFILNPSGAIDSAMEDQV